MDWTDCPLVEVNPRKVSGTPILRGSRMPADGIVENHLGGSPVEEIADNFEIAVADVLELVRYAAVQNSAIRL